MKLVGHWEEGQIKSGRWIYPNGIYYEGTFVNNKPSGQGVWHCKDGNVVKGSYEQKKKEIEEDAPPEDEGEEGAPAAQKFDLKWTSEVNIVESASKVNSVVLE
jgi:hypothetical protein